MIMKPLGALLGLLLALACAMALAQDFTPIPPLSARVTDTIGMLVPAQRDALENVLKEHEDKTGNQIAVLIVASTAPEAIEQYSIRVAEAWKLGRSGVDDGVILLVARDNPPSLRRLRIEAGRGVQGSLTDAQSKRILQDIIAPHFRQNDFYGGLVAGVSAIAALVDKENLPPPTQGQASQQSEDTGFWWPIVLFFVLLMLMRMFSRGSRRRALGANDWGRNAGIIIGNSIANEMGRRGGFGGGFGGGGFSGGSGGGYSGGGGTFDGGGASGNW
ncbi:TPM domain-containing protein [Noviherbaspirillum pedocola]